MRSLSGYGAICTLQCPGVSAAANAAAARSNSEFPRSTVVVWHRPRPTNRPVSDSCTFTADHLGGLDHLGGPGGHSMASEYLRSATISCQWRPSLPRSFSPAQQAKYRCYVINVCTIETRFRCLRGAGRSRRCYTCVLAYVHPPSTAPVEGLLETAAPGKQQVVVSRVMSCHSQCLVPCSSHAVAIGKRQMYPRVNSHKLD